ncbi:MAG: AAA family ATPase [Pirellulales bacterium]|nr:AAA family ATPase [Pirellulales bacterium]
MSLVSSLQKFASLVKPGSASTAVAEPLPATPATPYVPPLTDLSAVEPGPVDSAATTLKAAPDVAVDPQESNKLDHLLGRIAKLTGHESIERDNGAPKPETFVGKANPQNFGEAPGSTPDPEAAGNKTYTQGEFFPDEPKSYRDAKVTETLIEELILKFLLTRGEASGRECSDQIKMPFVLLEETLRQMKSDQWVYHRGAATMNDYVFSLTDKGRERARRHVQISTYYGAAPVALEDYIVSVKAQSLEKQHPTAADLQAAFADLLVNERMLRRLGPAVNSGRGMFLYGPAGNGKTSIAERITQAFGEYIWIPRAIGMDGEILRVFDPNCHVVAPRDTGAGIVESRKVDRRWIRIKRPTIVVGGELTLENLEVSVSKATGISEAPVQLKSNCGTLVIDDFGRQKMSTDALLNRWIVPLEKRYDFLNLASGKKIQVPFDQLIIFSTNLQPKDLVDEAFLRRIPYKIDVIDPTEGEFRELFKILVPKIGFEYRQEPIDYLIERYYKSVNRPFRNCQPRDLLHQVRNYCHFMNLPAELTNEYFDIAVENYFAVM